MLCCLLLAFVGFSCVGFLICGIVGVCWFGSVLFTLIVRYTVLGNACLVVY